MAGELGAAWPGASGADGRGRSAPRVPGASCAEGRSDLARRGAGGQRVLEVVSSCTLHDGAAQARVRSSGGGAPRAGGDGQPASERRRLIAR